MQINVGHRKARIARPLIAALAISLVLSTYLPSGAYAFQQPSGPTVTEKWDNGNTQTTTETTTSADGSQVVTTTHYDKDGTTKTGEQVDTYGKKPNDKVVIHRKVRKWKGDPNTTQPVQETTDTFDANNGSITGGTRTDVTRDDNGTETNIDTYVWEPNGKEPGGGHWKRTSHTPLKVENGLLRTEIKTANGTIVVNLPEDMEPGDKITGSVIMHPAGNTPEEQQKNEAELNGNVVSIAGHEIKGPGYAAILVPAVGAGLIDLLVRNPRGKKVTDQPIPITTSCPPAPPATDKPTPRDFHLPPVGQAGRPLRITGPFAGDVANTNVAVGGKPVPILAESPRETIAVAPHATGAMPLSVTDRGVTAVGEFVNLACRLSAGKTSMNIDETEPLWLKIDGVGALKGPASVRLQNFSPAVVGLSGGDIQTFQCSASDAGPDGTLVKTFTLTGRQLGTFSLGAQLCQENPSVPVNDDNADKPKTDTPKTEEKPKEQFPAPTTPLGQPSPQQVKEQGIDSAIIEANRLKADALTTREKWKGTKEQETKEKAAKAAQDKADKIVDGLSDAEKKETWKRIADYYRSLIDTDRELRDMHKKSAEEYRDKASKTDDKDEKQKLINDAEREEWSEDHFIDQINKDKKLAEEYDNKAK